MGSWVLSLAAVAATILVLPSAGVAAEPTQDSVVGYTDAEVYGASRLDVRSGPGGEAPQGSYRWTSGSPSGGYADFESTSISCLAVNGSTAVVGGFGTLSWDYVGPEGPITGTKTTGFVVVVVDHGPWVPFSDDGSYQDPIDEIGSAYSRHAGLRGARGHTTPGVPVRRLRRDRRAVRPDDKDQCKNGGWRTFPGFKNQGDCVSYVVTRGRNEPAGP